MAACEPSPKALAAGDREAGNFYIKQITNYNLMRFAIPTHNRELTAHFGHCENFAILTTENGEIISEEFIDPPVHQPGVYPKFLAIMMLTLLLQGAWARKLRICLLRTLLKYIWAFRLVLPQTW